METFGGQMGNWEILMQRLSFSHDRNIWNPFDLPQFRLTYWLEREVIVNDFLFPLGDSEVFDIIWRKRGLRCKVSEWQDLELNFLRSLWTSFDHLSFPIYFQFSNFPPFDGGRHYRLMSFQTFIERSFADIFQQLPNKRKKCRGLS